LVVSRARNSSSQFTTTSTCGPVIQCVTPAVLKTRSDETLPSGKMSKFLGAERRVVGQLAWPDLRLAHSQRGLVRHADTDQRVRAGMKKSVPASGLHTA
jgi:hypothetical protein